MVCKNLCPQVSLSLQGQLFIVDLYVLPIEGPNVVLGIQWLQLLGRVSHDNAAMTMEFNWDGSIVILRGETSLSLKPITFNQFQVLLHHEDIHSLFKLTMVQEIMTSGVTTASSLEFPTDLPPPVLRLLHQFKPLFCPPTGLPPYHLVNHIIHLQPNTKPINVRPYQYPQFQKTEMEKLIHEMFDQGIIHPNQSPLSSPMLLVRKKYGTYCFCVDYRALNAAIVKDKFPISTIDELIDELGGATVFSKLDLRVAVTIKYGCTILIYTKQSSAHMKAILNFL